MTLLDKQVILATIAEDDLWFLESGVAYEPLNGLYVWEEATSVTITHKWLDTLKSMARISWVSTNTDARFWVYIDGVQVLSNSQVSFLDISVQELQGVIVQVFDSVDHNEQAGFPVRFTLGWFRVPTAAKYKVEEFISAAFVERALIDQVDQGFLQWRSGPLADDVVHQFRIDPIGENGNSGTALTFSTLMVRVPDPPNVVITYDGAGPKTVTITAA